MSSSKPKRPISFRVDTTVLAWFQARFPVGYQAAMHQVLSDHVREQNLRLARLAGRAQEIYRMNYARCFWHYDKNLEITPHNISLVIDGLRKYGGRSGFMLAEELCQ